MNLTVFGVYKCDSGCGRTLPDPGMCPRCEEEVEALRRAYNAHDPHSRDLKAPKLMGWKDWVRLIVAAGLFYFIVIAFLWR